MPVSSLLTALIGFFGVVIGAIISASVTIYATNRQQEEANKRLRQQQEEANKRLRAEYYMERKAQAMADLHAELEDCFQAIEDFLDEMSRTTPVSEYENNVETKVDSFHKAFMRHSLYLTEEQERALFDMKSQFIMISADIEDFLTAEEENWDEEPRTHQGNLRDARDEAKEVLKREMDIPPQSSQLEIQND